MFCKRFREIVDMRNLNLKEIAQKSNLPYETIRNIYYGKVNDPKISTALIIAETLEMSLNCLVGRCEHTKEEREILQYYKQCGMHGKNVIHYVAKYEATSAKSERDALDEHTIPCLVPVGDIRNGIVYDCAETTEIKTKVQLADMAVKMTNNDLAPIYCKDDIILLEYRFPHSGEYAVFLIGDRAYVRKYIEEVGQYRLQCLHNMGKDIVVKRMDEVEYIGTCIGAIRAE